VARRLLALALQIGELVVAVEVDTEVLVARLVAVEQSLLDVRDTGRGRDGGHDVLE